MYFRTVMTSMMVTCLAFCFVSRTHGDKKARMTKEPVGFETVRADQQHSEKHCVSSRPSAELAIVGEKLLAYGANGSHNLRRMTDDAGWSIQCFEETENEVGPWGVVAASSGVAYVSSPPGYAYVLLRRPDDGSVIWEAKLAERGINYIRELIYCRSTASIIAVGDGNMPKWHSVLFSINEETGQFKQTEIPGKGILDACLLNDGRVAVSGSEVVGIYDPQNHSYVSLSESLGYSWAVAQFDAKRIVVSSGNTIKTINILSKEVEWSITVDGLIQALNTLPDGTMVAGCITGKLHYIQTENGRPVKVVSIHHGGHIRDIAYDQQESRLYIASSTGVSYYTRQTSNKALHTDARRRLGGRRRAYRERGTRRGSDRPRVRRPVRRLPRAGGKRLSPPLGRVARPGEQPIPENV